MQSMRNSSPLNLRPGLRALAATAALLASGGAMAAPYATTYHGTIANSGMPTYAPDGAAFTLTLVFDNGGSTAANQSWGINRLTCGFWRWSPGPAQSVTVALNLGGGVAQGAGSAVTNAAGALTAVFSAVTTGVAPLPWAAFGVSGLPAGGVAGGWGADGNPLVFGVQAPWGGSFDDGVAGGGVQMTPGRWSAPQPYTGACDATAVPPAAPAPAAAIPTLTQWGLLALSALLGLAALRRRKA